MSQLDGGKQLQADAVRVGTSIHTYGEGQEDRQRQSGVRESQNVRVPISRKMSAGGQPLRPASVVGAGWSGFSDAGHVIQPTSGGAKSNGVPGVQL